MSKSKINPKLILNDMDDIFKYLKQYEEGKINIKELSIFFIKDFVTRA